MVETVEPDFEGHEGRECGEHRTVGSHRATGRFSDLAPTFRRLANEMDAEAAALASSASVAPQTEETDSA